MTAPRVTVAMPVYNGARHIGRALDCILAQTHPNLEIIVVDNGSTDATPSIVAQRAAGDDRVQVHRFDETIAVMENFGRCLPLATGSYFMWAASDDAWDPTFVSELVAELEAHPECSVAMSAIDHRIDEEPSTFGAVRFDGVLDPSRRSPLRVALGQASGKVPYFQYIYGLYRTDFLRLAFVRFPRVVGSDGLFIVQVAMATCFRYVDRVLTTRGLSDRSWVEKYPDDALASRIAHPLGDVITLATAVPYLLRSPLIPLSRKLLLPVVFAVLARRHLTLTAGSLRDRLRRRHSPWTNAGDAAVVGLPAPHRIARRLARAGWRGAQWYWFLADRLATTPEAALIEVEPSVSVSIDRRDWLADAIYRGLYERAEAAIVRRLVPDGGVVVDVGANIGYYTMLAASLVGAGGRVLAFEPSARCVPVLERAAELAPGVVEVHAIAVGARECEADLVDGAGIAHSGLASLRAGASGAAQRVTVRTLDAVLDGIERIDLLKVDVEGFEPEVLAGATQTIGAGRVVVILCEVSPEFGAVAFAAELLELVDATHGAFVVSEVGTFRRRPVLTPVTAADVVARREQFNLLLVARSVSDRIQPLVAR